MPVPLSGVELLRLCTVLQDCAAQLSVLGHIMPDSYRGRPEADKVLSDYPQLTLYAELMSVGFFKPGCVFSKLMVCLLSKL